MEGGSKAYGTSTPTSDTDIRSVWIHTLPRYILGLNKWEHLDKKSGCDEFYWELRHFLNLSRRCNTQILEVLFNENWLEIAPEFKIIQSHKFELLDTNKFYKSIKGYCYNEFKLVVGIRTGLLGSKRKNDLEKYNYSPKNYVQYQRLCYCAAVFFQEGHFPVNIAKHNPEFTAQLMEVKLHPETLTKDQAEKLMIEAENQLDKSYENRKFNYKFNEELANKICKELYLPILNSGGYDG